MRENCSGVWLCTGSSVNLSTTLTDLHRHQHRQPFRSANQPVTLSDPSTSRSSAAHAGAGTSHTHTPEAQHSNSFLSVCMLAADPIIMHTYTPSRLLAPPVQLVSIPTPLKFLNPLKKVSSQHLMPAQHNRPVGLHHALPCRSAELSNDACGAATRDPRHLTPWLTVVGPAAVLLLLILLLLYCCCLLDPLEALPVDVLQLVLQRVGVVADAVSV